MYLDIIQYAKQGRALDKKVPVSEFTRLVPLLLESVNEINVQLEFDMNDNHLPSFKGKVTGKLILACQRCLQPMDLDVVMDLDLVLVTESQATDLDVNVDSFIYVDSKVNLVDLIEDELILEIPSFPKHREDKCDIDYLQKTSKKLVPSGFEHLKAILKTD